MYGDRAKGKGPRQMRETAANIVAGGRLPQLPVLREGV
jgi:hypothetical protein